MTARTTTQDTAIKRRRRATALICAVMASFATWSLGLPITPAVWAETAQPAFKIIVHPNNPVRSISQDFLAQAFFKQTMRWDHGRTIEPVDLPLSTPTREAFSTRILKRSVLAVRAYWLQRIFSGRQVPPLELESDAEVVRFVIASPGAVGYVSPSTETADAKVVVVQ
jgi:ABC-type phosphate transport system substrate-binding protein